MDWMALIAMGFALILIGFFAGIEIAFVSASKLSIELKKKQGSYHGKMWASFMEKPARFIGTTLIALNILLVIYGLLWSDMLDTLWKALGVTNFYLKLVVETAVSTFILLFFEFIFTGRASFSAHSRCSKKMEVQSDTFHPPLAYPYLISLSGSLLYSGRNVYK